MVCNEREICRSGGMPRPGSITLPESTSAFIPVRQQREERLVMGRDIRHQVLRVALSVKVNGKRRRLSLHSRPTFCARDLAHACETQCENYRNSLTGWRIPPYPKKRPAAPALSIPHTKISGTQSYPDTHTPFRNPALSEESSSDVRLPSSSLRL